MIRNPVCFFGLGFGYEVIFSEHRHQNVMIQLGFFPWKGLAVTLSPGILFHREETVERKLSLHLEAVYEFHAGFFEIGPAVGAAVAGGDVHLTLGIHIGKGF